MSYAPDHIAELALIEMSRMQREHGYDYAALEAYVAEQEKEKQHERSVSGPQDRDGGVHTGDLGRGEDRQHPVTVDGRPLAA